MKTSALFVLLMAAATFLPAHAGTSFDITKCRDYSPKVLKGLSATKLIEHDFINGTWTTTHNNGEEETYLFTAEGLVQILNTDPDGNKAYRSIFWRIDEFDSQPFLILSEDSGQEKLLSIDQTCEGLVLTDVVLNEVSTFDYQPLKASTKSNLTKAYMVGEWTNVSVFENVIDENKAAGSYLNYQFTADGTFTCNFGNAKVNFEEIGIWEVSKDCQYLLLHVAEGQDIEQVKTTKVIRIAQVDDHGLILEQVMKTNDINEFFGSDNKMYAFIK